MKRILGVLGILLLACTAVLAEQPEIRVGCELDFRPYTFADKEGRPTGFGVELLEAVADTMGLQLRIAPGRWDEVWKKLGSGEIDVLPVVARTPSREPLVDFSLPHTETFDAFFRRAGQPAFPNLAAAEGKEIVVLSSDAAHHELLERKFKGKIITVQSIPGGLWLIAKGKHDAFLCSKIVGVLERDEANIRGVEPGPAIPDYKRTFSFAVTKGNRELAEKLNQGLRLVKSNGEYDRLYDEWLRGPDPFHRWLPYVKWLLAAVLALGVLAATLQWLVQRRTRELRELNATLEKRIAERTATLRESEERFRSMADTAPSKLWVTDSEGRTRFLSRAWCEFTGQTESDALGKDGFGWLEAVHAEDREEAGRIFLEANSKREPFTLDYRVRRADGEYRWAIDSGRPRFDRQGNYCGYIGSVTDITERKLAEEALRASEQKYRRLHENMRDAFVVVDMAGRIQEFNPAYREMLGYSDTELRQLRYLELTPAKWHAQEAEIVEKQILPTGSSRVYEKEYRRKDGTVFPVELRTSLLRDEGGRPQQMWAIVRDITSRKQGEAELQESREQLSRQFEELEAIYRTAPLGLGVLDRDLRYRRVNQRFAEINGVTVEDHIGRTVREVVPSLAEQAEEVLRRVLKSGKSTRFEFRGETPAQPGVQRIWDEHWYPLRDGANQLVGVGVVVEEITERRRMEQELRETQRKLLLHSAQLEVALDQAQSASRAKDQFLANLSHELRTPLTPAVLQISILKRLEDLPPKAQRSLEIIERNLQVESRMVNDLLDLSRIVNNKLELNPARCDLHEIIDRALGVCLDGGNAKNLKVITELEASRREVCADGTRMQQVFWNLIQNAFKFTPAGGEIKIRSRNLNGEICVEVADSGCGIEWPLLGKLFQPFEQGHSDHKDALRGLGLGLAIAKRIVTAHGGELMVASEGKDRGTTFTVSLKTVEGETSVEERNKHEPKE